MGNFLVSPGFGDTMRIKKKMDCSKIPWAEATRWKAPSVDATLAKIWIELSTSTKQQFDQIMYVDREQWKQELLSHAELFERDVR